MIDVHYDRRLESAKKKKKKLLMVFCLLIESDHLIIMIRGLEDTSL